MLLYFKSSQWHQISVRGNRVVSAQRHLGGASVMAFNEIDVTPTPRTKKEIIIQRTETQQ